MKKLISIMLVIATVFTLTVISAGAVDVDVADTNAYYISEKPFEDIDAVDGINVIGHLGDLDFDKKVTVLDATKIQLANVKKTTLNSTQTLLADIDRDGFVSVMDATDIQRYNAKLGDTLNVAHTLYHRYTNSDKDVYQQIITFLKKYAKYTEGMGRYRYEFYNTDGSGYTMITYYESVGTMKISSVHTFENGASEGTLDIDISSDLDYCDFRTTRFEGSKALYDTNGEVKYSKEAEEKVKFEHEAFYTECNLASDDADILINEHMDIVMSSIVKFMGSHLDGDIYELLG